MTSLVRNIAVDCADPHLLASFWLKVLGGEVQEDDDPDDSEVRVTAGGGSGLEILFLAVPEGKAVKNRLHLDLQPRDCSRDEEVERVIGLGGTLVEDHRNADGTGWAVLTDLEGNEFCVLRSAAERAGRSSTTG